MQRLQQAFKSQQLQIPIQPITHRLNVTGQVVLKEKNEVSVGPMQADMEYAQIKTLSWSIHAQNAQFISQTTNPRVLRQDQYTAFPAYIEFEVIQTKSLYPLSTSSLQKHALA
jgi:dihydroorotase-like cyclic amidohydrolase